MGGGASSFKYTPVYFEVITKEPDSVVKISIDELNAAVIQSIKTQLKLVGIPSITCNVTKIINALTYLLHTEHESVLSQTDYYVFTACYVSLITIKNVSAKHNHLYTGEHKYYCSTIDLDKA